MSKELIVSVNGREKKIAIVEDDVVTEFYVERGDENQGIVGNIYKGRVMKVLPGMQSAFVDIGLERDSFLYVSDFLDDDELDETVVEGKKEVSRQPLRQDRKSQTRDAARIETAVPAELAEIDEEKDVELHVAALKHIEEISMEPVMEPVSDDALESLIEEDSEEKDEAPEITPRQRRQRRLRYTEQETGAERKQAESRKPEDVAKAESESEADGDEEVPGRGRRRRRRRRGDTAGTESAVNETEEPSEELSRELDDDHEFRYSPLVIVHHEPLERITDDDIAAAEGEMFKDALLQERISERIYQEERRTSLLEVEPTPEVHVGALRHAIAQETGLERISDDPTEPAIDKQENDADRDWRTGSGEDVNETFFTGSGRGGDLGRHEDDGAIDNGIAHRPVEVGESVELLHLDLTGDETENDPATQKDEDDPDDKLKDASAEIRQRPRRGEFATRRGGRGRRRGFRQRPGTNEATVEVEEDNGEPEVVQEPVIAPVPRQQAAAPIARQQAAAPIPRQAERFQRPVISDLLREGQEIIVQIAKEPIGQKGARITSHVALPGRYIVYMPTVEHIGVSRKIGTDEERQRLKRTLHQLRGETGVAGGFIVRTAANGCTIEELREDMQYLIRTWTDIRRRSERSKAPTIVHRDLDLVQRILRDQLSSDFNAIRVDNEFEYERVVDFVNRFAPKLVNRVKLYTKDTPILEHHGVQMEIDKAVKPRVWLKSGGYIVINQTEALVAIDVNTGKFVGKSNRLEDTIVKTNLEASKEIVRQIRLRDLGGIIVLDFIDMEERRNRQKVMQALEYELRNDRSPSKILQFNDFGLVAITRKRVKQSLERTLCTPCHYCGGGGMIKSAQTVCYEILAEARRVSKDVDNHNEVILRVNPDVAKTLRGTERDILNEIEAYLGGVVTIKSDPTVHQEQFDIALI